MSDRDRLIELLKETETNPEKTCPHYLEADCFKCPYDKGEDCDHEARKADYLLANGVFLLPEDLRGTQDFSISAFIEAMQMYKEKDLYIKAPCKVGDKVYTVGVFTGQVIPTVVIGIYYTANDMFLHLGNSTFVSVVHQLGKTVFLTKEEAEEKLKELGK